MLVHGGGGGGGGPIFLIFIIPRNSEPNGKYYSLSKVDLRLYRRITHAYNIPYGKSNKYRYLKDIYRGQRLTPEARKFESTGERF